MSKELTLPSGEKAYFREKPTGNGKKKLRGAGISVATNLSDYPELFETREGESDEDRATRMAAIKMRLTPEQGEFLDVIREATVLALLESWTLDRPLPKTAEELGEIDGDDYDALLDFVMEIPGATKDTDFSVVPPTEANAEDPTSGSSDSDGPSEEVTTDGESITTPGSDGSPTSGDSSTPEQS